MSEAQKNNLVPSEVSSTENTNSLIVEIDEQRLYQLEAHLAKLWEQYSELAERERYRLSRPMRPGLIPPKSVFDTEWYIRSGYGLTREIIQGLVNGNEFHIIPKVDPKTGTVKQVDYEVGSEKRRSRGSIFNSTQVVVDIVNALGLEATERPLTRLVLKPNFPHSISRPELRELPQPK